MNKNLSTREKIVASAIKLFGADLYENISIARICKEANVSNGIIYTYFKNKEELFIYLINKSINTIKESLSEIHGDTTAEKLECFIKANLKLTKENFSLICVYRAGQYNFSDKEIELKKIYNDSLEKVFNRKIDKYEHFFLMSGIRFINIYYTTRKLKCDTKFLAKSLLFGFLGDSHISPEKFCEMSFYLRIPLNNSNVKCQLLESGIELFKQKHFSKIKVNEITKSVSISSGAFYNYFPNKEEFLYQILKRFKKQVSYFLRDNYKKKFSPNENHVLILYLLYEYYEEAYFKYRLIREMEFIQPKTYTEFVEKDITFYMDTLSELNYSYEKKNILACILLGIAHYMGIDFFYTKTITDKFEFLNSMSNLFKNGVDKD